MVGLEYVLVVRNTYPVNEPRTCSSRVSNYNFVLAYLHLVLWKMANTHQSSSVPSSEDPFACFGADADGDSNQEIVVDNPEMKASASNDPVDVPRPPVTRDPLCGVLRYHRGTERSLLVYVENEVKSLDHGESLAQDVLNCIDKYSLERHWMMHCGPGKIADCKLDCF